MITGLLTMVIQLYLFSQTNLPNLCLLPCSTYSSKRAGEAVRMTSPQGRHTFIALLGGDVGKKGDGLFVGR